MSKITIVPHTSGALGYTMQMPEEEKFLNTKEELLTELRTLLGGRAAEQRQNGAVGPLAVRIVSLVIFIVVLIRHLLASFRNCKRFSSLNRGIIP